MKTRKSFQPVGRFESAELSPAEKKKSDDLWDKSQMEKMCFYSKRQDYGYKLMILPSVAVSSFLYGYAVVFLLSN